MMSERDLKRIEVLNEVLAGRRTVAVAASLLSVSERQAYRLLARYKKDGGFGLVHKARGRQSNRCLNVGVQKYAVALVKAHYGDFGPTLATEVLEDKHAIRIGRETLRRWMVAEGLWLSRKQRRTFHQPRLRRESYGELVQIDGSEHRWFEGRAEPCTLLVFIDDSTSCLMQLRFVPSESTDSYFAALRDYLDAHGCPVAFYFGQALGLPSHQAGSPGRPAHDAVWPSTGGKELRLAGVSDMDAGNAFLPGFMERFNGRFAIPAAKSQDLHRELTLPTTRLNDILCHREQRYVGAQLSFHYDRKQIILEQTELSKGLVGKYVELFDFADRPLEVRWKGHALPYRVFRKDQRVSHTAIVENKRLGHALAIVKAQQDLKYAPKIMTNSEKTGYQKRGRKTYGPPLASGDASVAQMYE